MADENKQPAAANEEKKEEKKEVKASPAVQKIIEAVEKLSVLELADLVKALEEKFGVSAAAMVAAAPAAAPAAGGEAAGGEAVEEKSEYTLVLTSAGANKIAVIKALREINPELGLKEAKDLAEAAPKEVKSGLKKEEAEEAKKKLEAAGAQVELK